jgi:AraC-like DNA-binding protein
MIQYFNWLPQIEATEGVASIPNELALFTYSDLVKRDVTIMDKLRQPHKFDFFMMIFHFAGSVNLKIDMVEYDLSTPNNSIRIMPSQIVGLESVSADFDAHVVIMSRSFLENLLVYINGNVSLRPGIKLDAIEPLQPVEVRGLDLFVNALRRVLQNDDNTYRMKVVQHVIMAIFYSSERLRDINDNDPARSSADNISRTFLQLVKDNFRQERQLKFYSDALCITPRYLSRVVRECTGSSASDWIERYVVLEARALLKSTNMTIQQISDYLNFPSQTFFGKYFKRRAGLSPKEYRRIG